MEKKKWKIRNIFKIFLEISKIFFQNNENIDFQI